MRHLAIGFLLTGIGVVVAVLALALSTRGEGEVVHAGPGDVTLVAIDMDITGNNDTTVGTIDDCKELANIGDTWTFDLIVQGVDPADKIAGYQVDIDYDPSVIQVDSVIA